jgi:MFS family permease
MRSSSEAPDHWRPATTFALFLGHFVFLGIMIGAQGVLWASLVEALKLSKVLFGSGQALASLASVLLLLLGGPLSTRAGKSRLALASFLSFALASLALAASSAAVGFIIALVVCGAAVALLEIAMNGATLDWEHATGRSVMNVLHSGFSAGAVVGALGAGVLLGRGWDYSQVLVALAILSVSFFVVTLPVAYPPSARETLGALSPGRALSMLRGERLVLVLAMISMFAGLSECVANLWSTIYLRELGARDLIAGAAVTAFNGAVLFGRLANAVVVNRLGARRSLLLSGAGTVVAGALLLATHDVLFATAAFLLLGLAAAGVLPTALSAGGRRLEADTGTLAGLAFAALYLSFIVGSPVIGWVAQVASLRSALSVVALSGVGILWLAGAVESPPTKDSLVISESPRSRSTSRPSARPS